MGEVIKKPVFNGSLEYISSAFSGFVSTGSASFTIGQNFCIKYVDENNFVFYSIGLSIYLGGVVGTDSGVITCTFSLPFNNGVCVADNDLPIQNNNLLYVNCNQPAIYINYHIHQNGEFFITGTLYYQ